jgi:hypothetical protein
VRRRVVRVCTSVVMWHDGGGGPMFLVMSIERVYRAGPRTVTVKVKGCIPRLSSHRVGFVSVKNYWWRVEGSASLLACLLTCEKG